MEKIILLETSTSRCSAALAVGGEVVAYKEDNTREHASLTAPFVKELLDGFLLEGRNTYGRHLFLDLPRLFFLFRQKKCINTLSCCEKRSPVL